MDNKQITIEKNKLQELYKTLTNYPAIAKEQVIYEMEKTFGKEAFKPQDMTERIKTFEDACNELGENHPAVLQYNTLRDYGANGADIPDIAAYLKLRIITEALNEGWKPEFTEDETRWYPWFWLYTQDEINHMDEDECRNRRMTTTGEYQTTYSGFAYARSNRAPSYTSAYLGSRLCFKTDALATYAGKQFIELWMDFCLIRK